MLKPLLKKISMGIAAFAVLGFVAGVLYNSSRISTVTVTLLAGQKEPKDLALPGNPGVAPDFCLQVRAEHGWIDCGTFHDTKIGDGLTWNVPGVLPERALIEYKLLESDRGFDDVLDQVPATAQIVEGNSFKFEQTTEFAMDAGFVWFMAHPIGKVIGLTFGIMVGLWLFSQFAI